MTKTSAIIQTEEKYNLRSYYTSTSITGWQKTILSKKLAEKLHDSSTSAEEIFWVIMSETNYWHAKTYYSPNPIINALFQLPAAQACIEINQHSLLTQENCYVILAADQPQDIKTAVLALKHKAILTQDSLSLVLRHEFADYAAKVLIAMHDRKIAIADAVKLFAEIETCLEIKIQNTSADRRDIGDDIIHVYSMLYACENLTDENMRAFEEFIKNKAYSDLPYKVKMSKLIDAMLLLEKGGLIVAESFTYMLANLQSQDFVKRIELITLLQIYKINLSPGQYYKIKETLNIFDLHLLLNKMPKLPSLPENIIFTAENINKLIEYGEILFNKNATTYDWQKILNINKNDLNALFKVCEEIRKDRITEPALYVSKINTYINNLNQPKIQESKRLEEFFSGFFEPRRETPNTKHPGYNMPPNIPSENTVDTPLIKTIKTMLLHTEPFNYKKILISFHTDQTKTLEEAFKKMPLSIAQNDQAIFPSSTLQSPEIFKNVCPAIIEWAQIKDKEARQTSGIRVRI
jgi:hypothetical protein